MSKKELQVPCSTPRTPGLELFNVKPIILGGDPTDPKNKIWLTREQHFELVRFWNELIASLRASK